VRRTHDGRVDGVDVVRHDLGERLEAVALDRLLAHDDVGRRTVADAARIAGRDGAVLGKDGGELAELLERRLRARVLVLLERDRLTAALLGRELDGRDLGLEGAGVEGCEVRRDECVSRRARRGGGETASRDAPFFHRCWLWSAYSSHCWRVMPYLVARFSAVLRARASGQLPRPRPASTSRSSTHMPIGLRAREQGQACPRGGARGGRTGDARRVRDAVGEGLRERVLELEVDAVLVAEAGCAREVVCVSKRGSSAQFTQAVMRPRAREGRTGRERHVVDAAGEDDVRLAELDLLRRVDDGLEAAAAEAVVEGGVRSRQLGGQGEETLGREERATHRLTVKAGTSWGTPERWPTCLAR